MADALLSVVGGGNGGGFPSAFANPAFSTFTLNGSTDAAEFVFQAADNVTITKLGIRVGVLTGTTPTYRISLQGVDASGNPDGTIKGGGSPASATFSPSGLGWSSNTWHWITLANSYACSAGEYLAIVVDYSSGTVDASNNAAITVTLGEPGVRFPYAIQNDATVRTRQTTVPVFGYGTASTVYGNPANSINARAIGSTTGTADEYGIKFTLPAAWGSTYEIRGVRFPSAMAAGGTVIVGLYGGTDATAANSTGATTEVTAFQTVTHDQDATVSTTGGGYVIWFDEATLTTLYYGATYRLSFQPQSANTITLRTTTLDAASDQDAFPLGQSCCVTTRLDVGNWTDVTAERMHVELILADITEPSGGSVAAMPIGGYVL